MTDTSPSTGAWRELLDDARLAAIASAAAGVPVHLVGGAVRDAGLGRPVNDLDVVVADRGPEIAARLAATTGARLVALGGERFGALRLVSGLRHIDIWDLQGGPLLADLWRRDFTVNAIALTVPGGAMTDPTGGVEDLARRRLRATRAEVFAEDPVRVLRLARLATTLPGFDADPETVRWARAATQQLAAMPHERLRVEVEILFSQSRFAPAADWCAALDLPAFFFGRGAVLSGMPASTLPGAQKLDDWRENQTTSPVEPSAAPLSPADSLRALHWSLFTELFTSSHAASAAHLRDLERRGLMTRACCDAALRLLAPAWEVPPDGVARRRWLHAAGPHWRDTIALRAALAASEGAVADWRNLEAEVLGWPASERAWILSPPALLSGEDVQRLLGIAPGPAVGAALARVRRAQVEGFVRVREGAEALLRSAPAAD